MTLDLEASFLFDHFFYEWIFFFHFKLGGNIGQWVEPALSSYL